MGRRRWVQAPFSPEQVIRLVVVVGLFTLATEIIIFHGEAVIDRLGYAADDSRTVTTPEGEQYSSEGGVTTIALIGSLLVVAMVGWRRGKPPAD